MPTAINPHLYQYPEPSKEELPYAELVSVDLSDIATEEGKQRQAKNLIEAVRGKGFFYVKGYDISEEAINKQYWIGKQLYDLPLSTKLKYKPEDLERGNYNGYRPAGQRVIAEDAEGEVHDQIETYNIPKFGHGWFKHDHPAPVSENLQEIEDFAQSLYQKILDPLYRLIARALELPEEFLIDLHRFDVKGEDHLRYMKYTHFNPKDTERIGSLWTQGHTDLGSITLLYAQSVAALQIQDPNTGEWSWVKYQPNTFTVNTCDALSFLTGGYIKSTIHRVRAPPKDQSNLDRQGLLYFARPNNEVILNTIKSPVLEREGFTQNEFERAGLPVPKMQDFVVAKQSWQQSRGRYKEGVEIVPGFTSRLYA